MRNSYIMSAEEARKQLEAMNTPEKLKKRKKILIQQTLNAINEEINNAILENRSDIYYRINEKIEDEIKIILIEQGYQIISVAYDRYTYRIEWRTGE